MRAVIRSVTGLLVLLSFWPCAVQAQFDQYTAPGGPTGKPVDRKGALRREVSEARWTLGPVRVDPLFGVKDVEYVRNLVGAGTRTIPPDLTATAVAGARAYLPTGPDVTWSAYGEPEYVWWEREVAQRRLDGLYGMSVDGFWNRLTLNVDAASEAQQQVASAEIPSLTHARTDHAGLSTELGLSGGLSLFMTGKIQKLTFLDGASSAATLGLLSPLDREERVERAGLRWRPGRGWVVGVGAEHSDATFSEHDVGVPNRSNAGTAPVLEMSYDHGRLFFSADLAQRSLTATQGSSFVKYSKTTGNASIAWDLTQSVALWIYANRGLEYTVLTDYSYFEDFRHGASLHLNLGRRTQASVFAETGTLTYTTLFLGIASRRDDLVSYGGTLSFAVIRGVAINLVGSSTRFTSNLPGFNRSLNVVGVTVTLGNLGRPGGGHA